MEVLAKPGVCGIIEQTINRVHHILQCLQEILCH